MGVPQNNKLVMSYNGKFRGTPILGNPHLFDLSLFRASAKDQVSSSDWLAVFQDVSDAQTALSGVEDHGHGLQFRMATIADIRQKAFNRWGPSRTGTAVD